MGQTMKTTASETFEGAAEEANRWLEAVMQELKTKDRDVALAVLRAGLHALRDRMGAAHAARLGEQLPMLVRGVFYEGWRPAVASNKNRHVDEFLDRVETYLPANSNIGAEAVALATFSAFANCFDIREKSAARNSFG